MVSSVAGRSKGNLGLTFTAFDQTFSNGNHTFAPNVHIMTLNVAHFEYFIKCFKIAPGFVCCYYLNEINGNLYHCGIV